MQPLTFGVRLRQMREEAGISRRDLAARVQLAETYIEKLERGYSAPPSALAIADIARALRVDGDELFALAGKLAPDLERALRSSPLLVLLCRAALAMKPADVKAILLNFGVSRAKLDWQGCQVTANDERRVRRDAVTSELKRAVFHLDDHECVYCSARNLLEVDHIQPVALGGTNDIENLVTACERCNKKKGSRAVPFVMVFGRFRGEVENGR